MEPHAGPQASRHVPTSPASYPVASTPVLLEAEAINSQDVCFTPLDLGMWAISLRLAHRKPAHPRPPQQRRAALPPRRFRHRAHGLAPPPPRTPRQARVGHALAPRSSTCSASRCDFGHPQAPRTTCHLISLCPERSRRAAVPTAPLVHFFFFGAVVADSAAVVRGTWVSCAWAEVYFLFGAREAGVLCS